MEIKRFFFGSMAAVELLAAACSTPPNSYREVSVTNSGIWAGLSRVPESNHSMPLGLRGKVLEWLGDYCEGSVSDASSASLEVKVCTGTVHRFTGSDVAGSSVILCPSIAGFELIQCVDSGVFARPLRDTDLKLRGIQ